MNFDKTKNKIIGNKGEEEAAKYLVSQGYKILDRNIYLGFGEIDILAQKSGTVVIVEVKSVSGDGFGLAQDLVRYKKQNKLRLLARAVEQKYPGKTIRVDVIGVDLSSALPRITHLESAVEG
jgi:putative endonuclease